MSTDATKNLPWWVHNSMITSFTNGHSLQGREVPPSEIGRSNLARRNHPDKWAQLPEWISAWKSLIVVYFSQQIHCPGSTAPLAVLWSSGNRKDKHYPGVRKTTLHAHPVQFDGAGAKCIWWSWYRDSTGPNNELCKYAHHVQCRL